MNRLIGIGDIHGCLHTLRALMDQIQPTEDDMIIFTGDYVDRGRFSCQVIDFLIAFKQKFPRTQFVKGNHEDLFMRHLDNDFEHRRCFFWNGGHSTVNSYDEVIGVKPYKWEDMPDTHVHFLRELAPIVEVGDYIFVHGGLRPGIPLEEQAEHDMTWIRDEFLWSRFDFGKTIVHGHTPMDAHELETYHMKFRNKINLDSGCVYGHELTAVDVFTREEWTQPLITIDRSTGVH